MLHYAPTEITEAEWSDLGRPADLDDVDIIRDEDDFTDDDWAGTDIASLFEQDEDSL